MEKQFCSFAEEDVTVPALLGLAMNFLPIETKWTRSIENKASCYLEAYLALSVQTVLRAKYGPNAKTWFDTR